MLLLTIGLLYIYSHTLINKTYVLDSFWWISLDNTFFPDAHQRLQLASVYRPTKSQWQPISISYNTIIYLQVLNMFWMLFIYNVIILGQRFKPVPVLAGYQQQVLL
jgi:hypothetical protein